MDVADETLLKRASSLDDEAVISYLLRRGLEGNSVNTIVKLLLEEEEGKRNSGVLVRGCFVCARCDQRANLMCRSSSTERSQSTH